MSSKSVTSTSLQAAGQDHLRGGREGAVGIGNIVLLHIGFVVVYLDDLFYRNYTTY